MARKPDIARRRDIARQAFAAIRERGVHRTSMSDIAAALDMKRPTLYWYFKDLGEIFDAAAEEIDAQWGVFVAGRLAGVDHPIDYLETLLAASTEFYEGRREDVIVLFQLLAVGAQPRERMLARSAHYITPMRAGLIDRLRAGIAAGRVAPCDPEKIVDIVLAVADGSQVQRVTRDADPTPMVDAISEYVLAPLRIPRTGARKPRSERHS